MFDYNKAKEELNELAGIAAYIEKYEVEEGIYSDDVLESDKEYFISDMKDTVNSLIKGDKMSSDAATEALDHIRALTSGTSLKTKDEWDKLIEKRGFNVPALKQIRRDGLQKFKRAGKGR